MWQPIETAPKGRRFLGAYKTKAGLWICEVCWFNSMFNLCLTVSSKIFPATVWAELPNPPGETE